MNRRLLFHVFLETSLMCVYLQLLQELWDNQWCCAYQLLMHLLHILEGLVNIILGATERHNITLLAGVREGDLNLVESVSDLPDFLSLRSDYTLVETLFNYDVLGFFIFLLKCNYLVLLFLIKRQITSISYHSDRHKFSHCSKCSTGVFSYIKSFNFKLRKTLKLKFL